MSWRDSKKEELGQCETINESVVDIPGYSYLREERKHKKGLGLLIYIANDLDFKHRTSLSEIPKIRVAQEDGKWYTLDNRRLWVFKSLENRGQCGAIRVRVVDYLPDEKFTTDNDGQWVEIE